MAKRIFNKMNCRKWLSLESGREKKSAANIIHVSLLRENLGKCLMKIPDGVEEDDDNLQKIFVLFKLLGNLLKSVRKSETMFVNVSEGRREFARLLCALHNEIASILRQQK